MNLQMIRKISHEYAWIPSNAAEITRSHTTDMDSKLTCVQLCVRVFRQRWFSPKRCLKFLAMPHRLKSCLRSRADTLMYPVMHVVRIHASSAWISHRDASSRIFIWEPRHKTIWADESWLKNWWSIPVAARWRNAGNPPSFILQSVYFCHRRVADPLSKSCLGDPPTIFFNSGMTVFFEKFNTEMVRGSTARRP